MNGASGVVCDDMWSCDDGDDGDRDDIGESDTAAGGDGCVVLFNISVDTTCWSAEERGFVANTQTLSAEFVELSVRVTVAVLDGNMFDGDDRDGVEEEIMSCEVLEATDGCSSITVSADTVRAAREVDVCARLRTDSDEQTELRAICVF